MYKNNPITRDDIKLICRICLINHESMTIISSLTSPNYLDTLTEYFPVHDSYFDPFPYQICNNCLLKLKIVYEFKQDCIHATKTLQTIIVHQTEDKISENEETLSLKAQKVKSKTYKYTCSDCNKGFNYLSTLGAHCKGSHNAIPITCTKCPAIFYHPLQLKQHFNFHEKDNNAFVCDVCGKIFKRNYQLKYHQSAHSEVRPFKCSICNRGFKQKFNLKIHIKIRHDEVDRREMCNICGKLILPVSLRAHLDSHKTLAERSFKCSECDRIYSSKTALRTHFNEKHRIDVKTFECKLCDKVLVSKRTLTKHMIIMHSNMKKIECHVCGKSYKLQSHVKAHILSAHLDVRPHVCSICNKAFHTKVLLKNHMRTHTGERPFSCTICGKRFGFKNVLNTHMKVHLKS